MSIDAKLRKSVRDAILARIGMLEVELSHWRGELERLAGMGLAHMPAEHDAGRSGMDHGQRSPAGQGLPLRLIHAPPSPRRPTVPSPGGAISPRRKAGRKKPGKGTSQGIPS